MDQDRISWLNARLPTKRAIGHGLIRSVDGRVLLCQLTYKQAWDLPGGVVELGESPRLGCLREVEEELGLAVHSHGLLAVNWMPAWRGWDDACTFLFDLGVHALDLLDRLALQRREIAAVHWCTREDVQRQAASATARLLDQVLPRLDRGETGTLYVEDAQHPPALSGDPAPLSP